MRRGRTKGCFRRDEHIEMGTNTEELLSKIKSVNSTLQLSKAMGLVALAKIRRAGNNMSKSGEYMNSLEEIIKLITSSAECRKSAFMSEPGTDTKLVVIAGDRGMAGGYNSNVFRLLSNYPEAKVIPIGKKACNRFGKEILMAENFSTTQAIKMADKLCSEFINNEFGKLGIVYTKYFSMMKQEAQIKWLLPLNPSSEKKSVLFEPDEVSILDVAVREYIGGTIYALVCESFLSEVASRKIAMDSASKNAEQMINDMNLEYNRIRQGEITQEITEIISGNEM